jgi:hypothetical protein
LAQSRENTTRRRWKESKKRWKGLERREQADIRDIRRDGR